MSLLAFEFGVRKAGHGPSCARGLGRLMASSLLSAGDRLGGLIPLTYVIADCLPLFIYLSLTNCVLSCRREVALANFSKSTSIALDFSVDDPRAVHFVIWWLVVRARRVFACPVRHLSLPFLAPEPRCCMRTGTEYVRLAINCGRVRLAVILAFQFHRIRVHSPLCLALPSFNPRLRRRGRLG